MIILPLLLIVLASAQQCPYCQYSACTITSQGLGNCSACNVGALVSVIAGSSQGASYEQTIGICQQCPSGCQVCQYGMFYPAAGGEVFTLGCTTCAQNYALNYSWGQNCVPCPANCVNCSCNAFCQIVWCSTCSTGYTLANPGTSCTPTTAALSSNESESSNVGLTIGLSVWGSVMTIAAIVFLVLWQKRKSEPLIPGLLNSEIEVGKIRS